MKEKTAMQMFYELIDSEVVRLSKVKGKYKKASEQCANQLVILKMKANNMNFIQKEREQIEKAFEDGQDYYNSNMNDRQYYQSKYGDEEKRG